MAEENNTQSATAALEAQVAKLTEDFSKLNELFKSQSKEMDAISKKVKTLQAENAELKKAAAEADDKTEGEEKVIELPTTLFEVNGLKYKFIVPKFIISGKQMTALDALSNPDLLAALVEKQSGLIALV